MLHVFCTFRGDLFTNVPKTHIVYAIAFCETALVAFFVLNVTRARAHANTNKDLRSVLRGISIQRIHVLSVEQ